MKTECYRILLVEDNLADVLLIEETLRRRCIAYVVDHYLSASSAIHAVKTAGADGGPVPDLMLLDYNIPGGQGRDILAAARGNSHLAAVPCAIVSSCLGPQELKEVTRLGATCVILKPSSFDEFLSQVGEAIEKLLRTADSEGSVAKKIARSGV